MVNNPSTWEGQKAFWDAVKATGSTKAQDVVDYWRDRDKGEQCVYCGKDSWTCEHFEPPILDGSESEGE